jgi:hypothetical protein
LAQKKKKKKKTPAMTKRVKSPSKKQRRTQGHSGSPTFLSPGANGTIINSGGGPK